MANLEHQVRITPSTVFDVASVSKQFAGLAIAVLVEQGKVQLSDDVRKYIPEMGDVGHVITIGHLVHHTSGLRDWPGSLSLAGWRYDDVISFDQILRFAYAQRSLNFKPGDEYTYSNTGYNLLARVVEKVTGRSFRQWTQENIFGQLGMTRSHFHDDFTEVVTGRATGYARAADGWRASTDNLTALGSSSLFSTVEDMAKWVINFDEAKAGGRTALALARTQVPLNNGSNNTYAFGLVSSAYRGQPVFQHSGSWAQFATYVVHFPQFKGGVVVFANAGTINATRAAYDVADAFFGSELGPVAPVADANADAPAVSVSPDVLDRYVGLYRLGEGWFVRISRQGSGLTSQATRESPAPMSPRSDSSFWVSAYRDMMTFTTPRQGPSVLMYRGQRRPRLDEGAASTSRTLSDFVGEYSSEELGTTYRVVVGDSGLVMHHYRHGPIPLTRLWKDEFTGVGAARFMRSVEFVRDAAGKVTGLSVFIDERSRNIRFARKRS